MDERPGCDGTITRAIQQGREITTYERCPRCEEREKALLDRFRDIVIPGPPPIVTRPPSSER